LWCSIFLQINGCGAAFFYRLMVVVPHFLQINGCGAAFFLQINGCGAAFFYRLMVVVQHQQIDGFGAALTD
jgi:hypothetical protein